MLKMFHPTTYCLNPSLDLWLATFEGKSSLRRRRRLCLVSHDTSFCQEKSSLTLKCQLM